MVVEIAPIFKDGTYLANNPDWHVQDSPWKAAHIAEIIERNRLNPQTICEIGCGAGEILKQLSDRYPDKTFTGYEISPQAFALCRKRSGPHLDFKYGDLLTESTHFDVVMAIDVFEHVEDYWGFLRKLRDRGAYKIFHIPLDISVQGVLRGTSMMRGRRTVGHIHYFTKETALATLEDIGYSVEDYFYTGGAVELAGRGWKSQILKIPRKMAFFINQDFGVRLLGGYSLMVLAR